MKFMLLYYMGNEIVTATGSKEEVMKKAKELREFGISSQIYPEDKIEEVRELLKSKALSSRRIN